MTFNGTYLEIDGQALPSSYVCSYKCNPDRRTDKNSNVDSKGVLKRKILPHKRTSISFTTGYITDDDMAKLSKIFEKRDSMSVKYWKPTEQKYETGTFYVADFEIEVLMCVGGVNYYRPITFELIEY